MPGVEQHKWVEQHAQGFKQAGWAMPVHELGSWAHGYPELRAEQTREVLQWLASKGAGGADDDFLDDDDADHGNVELRSGRAGIKKRRKSKGGGADDDDDVDQRGGRAGIKKTVTNCGTNLRRFAKLLNDFKGLRDDQQLTPSWCNSHFRSLSVLMQERLQLLSKANLRAEDAALPAELQDAIQMAGLMLEFASLMADYCQNRMPWKTYKKRSSYLIRSGLISQDQVPHQQCHDFWVRSSVEGSQHFAVV